MTRTTDHGKRHFWPLAVLMIFAAAQAIAAVSGEWRVNLIKGTTTVQPHSAGATQEAAWAACQARIPTSAPTTTTYKCQTPTYVAVVTADPPPPTNSPPTISGTPPAAVQVGAAYSFTPTASDPNGDALSFAIANRPTWATFSATTGALTGTPALANVGITSGVKITVSDGKGGSASTAVFTITVTAPVTPPPTGTLSVLACRNSWGASDNCGGCSELVWSAPDVDDYVNTDTSQFWTKLGALPGTAKVLTSAGKTEGAAAQCVTTRTPVSELLPTFPPPPGANMRRINVGGAALTDTAGNAWEADNGFNTGFSGSEAGPVEGTLDDGLIQSLRWDEGEAPELDYAFTVANGAYTVKLYFFEGWSGGQAVGRRVFDVLLEGQLAIDNLDIFAAAGGKTLLVKTLTTTVADGRLDIGFRHGAADNPVISAIEFSPGATDPPPPATGSAALSWTVPTKNTDGSTLADLAGYRILYGTSPTALTQMVQVPGAAVSSFVVEGLPAGSNYFALRAYSTSGAESNNTEVVSKVVAP